jgi:phosphoribosylformimino-5-aminoimidazole carboxamide ribotide isomerase
MLQGPNTGLYRSLMQDFPSLQFTASGGIASIGDVAELEAAGLTEAISGKAIFENRLDMQQLKPYL